MAWKSFVIAILSLALAQAQNAGRRTENVVILMSDGLRWQEVFSGADSALLDKKKGGVANPEDIRRRFWRDSAGERRAALLPFLWSEAARHGQIFGDRQSGSEVIVSNGLNSSYPGYSETFCGVVDPAIRGNSKRYNPNVNVLEFLSRKPGFAGRVAAFGAWEQFPWILNAPRSGIFVNGGYDPLTITPMPASMQLLNQLKAETEYWQEEAFDSFTFRTALAYLTVQKPRVIAIILGETDEWAHEGRYDLYLKAAHRFDQYARELWDTIQSLPEYRDRTTLILATDHGRGSGTKEWRSHGRGIPESRFVWMAFLGPDTYARGVRERTQPIRQAQLAATIAAYLGENFLSAVPAAAPPIEDVLRY